MFIFVHRLRHRFHHATSIKISGACSIPILPSAEYEAVFRVEAENVGIGKSLFFLTISFFDNEKSTIGPGPNLHP